MTNNRKMTTTSMKHNTTNGLCCLLAAAAIGLAVATAADPSAATTTPPAKPDGKPADMSKPVQVFILLGQSNMVGLGKVAGPDGSLEFAVKEKSIPTSWTTQVRGASGWMSAMCLSCAREIRLQKINTTIG